MYRMKRIGTRVQRGKEREEGREEKGREEGGKGRNGANGKETTINGMRK